MSRPGVGLNEKVSSAHGPLPISSGLGPWSPGSGSFGRSCGKASVAVTNPNEILNEISVAFFTNGPVGY